MGAWGTEAWANDRAADWFGRLFTEGKLAERIIETLVLDATEHCEEIRAATKMVVMLNQPQIWPTGVYSNLVAFALQRLEEVLVAGHYTHPDMVADIESDIDALWEFLVDESQQKNQLKDSLTEERKFEP